MSTDLESWGADLRERLGPAIAADIRWLTDGVAAGDVLGVGGYTDADASNIVVAVLTRAHHEALVQRRPEYPNYFRWSIGEWDRLSFEVVEEDPLQPINDDLAARADHLGESATADLIRSVVWESIVAAFAGVVVDGLLDRFPHAVRVFEPTDADVAEETVRQWTARINDEGRMVEYDAWAANPSS